MKEAVIAHIWKYLLFDVQHLQTVDGQSIQIIDNGIENTDAGPDFSNAKIRIGETIWAGNIEIHIKSSEWEVHKHQNDEKYKNVILHVVYEYNKPAFDVKGNALQTLELKRFISSGLLQKIDGLVNNKAKIPCANLVNEIGDFEWFMWKEHLLIERLLAKSEQVNKLLEKHNNDWESVFFIFLARAFGLKINAETMMLLAASFPVAIIKKEAYSLLSLEAILFGQAGFLAQDNIDDAYFLSLKKEYSFQQHKHKIEPIDVNLWKFLRLRPPSFPTIRIAQLANLLFQTKDLLGDFIALENLDNLTELLTCSASKYWDNHFTFGKESKQKREKKLGKSTIQTIIINAICPVLFMYGKAQAKPELCDKSIAWLQALKPEKNRIIIEWNALNIACESAADSQSLIHLFNNYCAEKRCLDCRIGKNLVNKL